MSFVSHVECTVCGHRHEPKRLLTVCAACGQMLAVRYDLERVKARVTKDAPRPAKSGEISPSSRQSRQIAAKNHQVSGNAPARSGFSSSHKREDAPMRSHIISVLTVAAGALALTACSGPAEDAANKQADAVEQSADVRADALENQADATRDAAAGAADAGKEAADATADSLERKADAVEDAGEKQADAIKSETDRKY